MPQLKVTVPAVLRIGPMEVACPLCHAKPKKDCSTNSGKFARMHLVRIAAAALLDIATKRKHRGTKRVAAKAAKRALVKS
jgi:hypothetical protein